MKLYCEKRLKSTMIVCKKYLVVIERGVPKIIYFRLYKDKAKDGTYKPVTVNSDIINGLYDLNDEYWLSDVDLKHLVENIRNTYQTLKKHNKQDMVLKTLTEYFFKNSKHPLHLGHGIPIEDGSMVFFYDYSDIIDAKFNAIFINGGLL